MTESFGGKAEGPVDFRSQDLRFQIALTRLEHTFRLNRSPVVVSEWLEPRLTKPGPMHMTFLSVSACFKTMKSKTGAILFFKYALSVAGCRRSFGISGAILSALFVAALTGCISVPPVPVGKTAAKEDMFSHVEFLSQPRLKGRKPGSLGSRAARQYIAARFKAYGLVPWGGARDYEQSFNYGRNIVAVLPGSDPGLAKEFVLVSA